MSYRDREPFHYRRAEIMAAANDLPRDVGPAEEWGHPRNHMMVRFTRTHV
jgi:hypothetical protein